MVQQQICIEPLLADSHLCWQQQQGHATHPQTSELAQQLMLFIFGPPDHSLIIIASLFIATSSAQKESVHSIKPVSAHQVMC